MQVKLIENEFKPMRTAYNSDSIFIAVLINSFENYDEEIIGEKIMGGEFGCVEPPGPSFGFGVIKLPDDNDGKLKVTDLLSISKKSIKEDSELRNETLESSLEEYMDGFFIVDNNEIKQVKFKKFFGAIKNKDYQNIHFVEFEPDFE